MMNIIELLLQSIKIKYYKKIRDRWIKAVAKSLILNPRSSQRTASIYKGRRMRVGHLKSEVALNKQMHPTVPNKYRRPF